MVLADTGEEVVAVCSCGYGANLELASYKRSEDSGSSAASEAALDLEEVHTPDSRTVEEVSSFMDMEPSRFIKTLVYDSKKGPVVYLVRGDHELKRESHS